MKTLFLIFILSVSVLTGCKKADYNCTQKVTTTRISGTSVDSNIQYSDFQIIGDAKCVVGKTSKETNNGDNSRIVVVTDTKCN